MIISSPKQPINYTTSHNHQIVRQVLAAGHQTYCLQMYDNEDKAGYIQICDERGVRRVYFDRNQVKFERCWYVEDRAVVLRVIIVQSDENFLKLDQYIMQSLSLLSRQKTEQLVFKQLSSINANKYDVQVLINHNYVLFLTWTLQHYWQFVLSISPTLISKKIVIQKGIIAKIKIASNILMIIASENLRNSQFKLLSLSADGTLQQQIYLHRQYLGIKMNCCTICEYSTGKYFFLERNNHGRQLVFTQSSIESKVYEELRLYRSHVSNNRIRIVKVSSLKIYGKVDSIILKTFQHNVALFVIHQTLNHILAYSIHTDSLKIEALLCFALSPGERLRHIICKPTRIDIITADKGEYWMWSAGEFELKQIYMNMLLEGEHLDEDLVENILDVLQE